MYLKILITRWRPPCPGDELTIELSMPQYPWRARSMLWFIMSQVIRQVIGSPDIDIVWQVNPPISWGRFWITFAVSVRSDYEKYEIIPDSKVHGANMGPIWGRQNPGGPHVGPLMAHWTLLSGMSIHLHNHHFKISNKLMINTKQRSGELFTPPSVLLWIVPLLTKWWASKFRVGDAVILGFADII